MKRCWVLWIILLMVGFSGMVLAQSVPVSSSISGSDLALMLDMNMVSFPVEIPAGSHCGLQVDVYFNETPDQGIVLTPVPQGNLPEPVESRRYGGLINDGLEPEVGKFQCVWAFESLELGLKGHELKIFAVMPGKGVITGMKGLKLEPHLESVDVYSPFLIPPTVELKQGGATPFAILIGATANEKMMPDPFACSLEELVRKQRVVVVLSCVLTGKE